jgi:hypothetical protein
MSRPNVEPIFTRVADIQWIGDVVAANTNQDLSSGTSYLVFEADADNGGYVQYIRIKPNPANNTAATVARIWINNGGSLATPANSALFADISIPATTASNSASLVDFTIPINLALPPGYKLYLTLGTAPGGSGEFTAIAVGGKY